MSLNDLNTALGLICEIHFLGLQWSISEARFVSGGVFFN